MFYCSLKKNNQYNDFSKWITYTIHSCTYYKGIIERYEWYFLLFSIITLSFRMTMVRRILQSVHQCHFNYTLSFLCKDASFPRTFQSFFLLIWFFDHLIRNIRSSSHQEIRKHYCLSSLRLTSSFINTRSDVALMMKREKFCCRNMSIHILSQNRVATIQ